MSKCISPHGEYSEHEGIGEYCDWCGACNHEAIRRNAKIEALREAAESKDLIDHMYRTFAGPTSQSLAVRATSKYMHNQADQIERESNDE